MNTWHLKMAARAVHRGGVIAYPTEAVYGLGCDPLNPQAVHQLLALKQRPLAKGLILIGANLQQLTPYMAKLDEKSLQQLKASWPGPVTWLVPAAPGTPAWLRGEHDTLALRVTDHPLASALCLATGHALVSTSANLAGHPPARTALRVRQQFGSRLDYLLSGPTGGQTRPTTIRDLQSGRILREA